MNILHVVDSFSPIGGGSQTSVLLWLKELVRQPDLKLRVISNKASITFPLHKDQLLPLPTVRLPWLFANFSMSWRVPKKIENQILDFKPDLLHLHDPQLLSPYFIQFARRHHIPVVSTFHTHFQWCADNFAPPTKWSMQLVAYMQQYVFEHSTAITTPSKYWQKYYQARLDKPVYEVPYPIEANFFDFQPTLLSHNNQVRLITTSRLTPEKKIDALITMMQYLNDRFTLTIVGDGKERSYLEKLVKDLHLANRVKLVGWKNQQEQVMFYHQHHLFLSMSNFETFGLTYIESLATGTPGLVFDYPVSREVVPPGTASFINSLDPHQWAERIKDIFDKDVYGSMINSIDQSRKQFNRYKLEKSTQALMDIYRLLSFDLN